MRKAYSLLLFASLLVSAPLSASPIDLIVSREIEPTGKWVNGLWIRFYREQESKIEEIVADRFRERSERLKRTISYRIEEVRDISPQPTFHAFYAVYVTSEETDLVIFIGSHAADQRSWSIREFLVKERQPNQALQTTPMTRSGTEKTIEFGRPQRGV